MPSIFSRPLSYAYTELWDRMGWDRGDGTGARDNAKRREDKARALLALNRANGRACQQGLPREHIDKVRVFERDKWRCGICHRKVDKRLTYPHPRSASLDHIIPRSQGGPHLYINVQCSHLSCNLRKRTKSCGEQLLLFG
jgi:5-methylcytosine-specific restriction endonuclease McrA